MLETIGYQEIGQDFDINQALFQEMNRLGLKIVPNRLKSRPPIDPQLREEGIISDYDFFEQQDPLSGLFPSEIRICREIWDASSYLGRDQTLILPATAYSLYGHHEQWRNSGRPYFEHIGDVVREAIEIQGFKFPWWAVAAGFVHDLHEDSWEYGHRVRPEQVRDAYSQLGYRSEGEFIYRTVHAMTKFGREPASDRIKEKARTLIFRERPIPDDIRTVMRLYDTLLELEGTDLGDEVVIPWKLIDNLVNFDRFLDKETRQRRARKTLRIYVPMAEAFHLHTLRDELALLALEELYPETVKRLKETQSYLQAVYQSLESRNLGLDIAQTLRQVTPIAFWFDLAPPIISFSVPSIYDLYKAETSYKAGTKKDDYKPHIKLQILLPELPGFRETDFDWKSRAEGCYRVLTMLGEIIKPIDLPENIHEWDLIPNRFHFTFRNNDVDFQTTIISEKQRMADHASLLDLFTHYGDRDIGTNEEWQELAIENLQNVRQRYAEARKHGNLAAFFGSIAGEKRIYDEKGNPQQFPSGATVLDAISVLYGEDVFYVKSAKVKDLEGHVWPLIGNGLLMALFEGEQIIGFSKEKRETIEPDWLDHVVIDEIKEMYIQRLQYLCERDIKMKEKARQRGDDIIQKKLADSWEAFLGFFPKPDSQEMHLRIPPRYVQFAFSNRYKNELEFLFRVGLNQIDEDDISIIDSVVEALVEYRNGVKYFGVQMPDTVGAASGYLNILQQNGLNLIREVGQVIPGPGGEGKAWFHVNELGKTIGERKKKFTAIKKQLEAIGYKITYPIHPARAWFSYGA